MIGDTVPAGTPMRVRAVGTPGAGLVSVRTGVVNADAPTPGETLIDSQPLAPGGVIDFTAPSGAGWVYATLSAPEALAQRTSTCDAPVNAALAPTGKQTTYCRAPVATL